MVLNVMHLNNLLDHNTVISFDRGLLTLYQKEHQLILLHGA